MSSTKLSSLLVSPYNTVKSIDEAMKKVDISPLNKMFFIDSKTSNVLPTRQATATLMSVIKSRPKAEGFVISGGYFSCKFSIS